MNEKKNPELAPLVRPDQDYTLSKNGHTFKINFNKELLHYQDKGFTFAFLDVFVEPYDKITYLVKKGEVITIKDPKVVLEEIIETCSKDKKIVSYLKPQLKELLDLCEKE